MIIELTADAVSRIDTDKDVTIPASIVRTDQVRGADRRGGAGGRGAGPADVGRSAPDDFETCRRLEHLRRLDAARVPNGTKAIAIWLHRHWDDDLVARWGPHANPHTVKKWRTDADRGCGAGSPA